MLTAWFWPSRRPAVEPIEPVVPVAVAPVRQVVAPLDEAPPLLWQRLLDEKRPPVPALWDPGRGFASWQFQPNPGQLNVSTDRTALFRLGELTQPNFIFQVSAQQPTWTAGVGIYLGYRTELTPAERLRHRRPDRWPLPVPRRSQATRPPRRRLLPRSRLGHDPEWCGGPTGD